MKLHDTQNSDSAPSGKSDVLTMRCKLFKDKVTVRLCLLRKLELGTQNEFSCEGCPWRRLSPEILRDDASSDS